MVHDGEELLYLVSGTFEFEVNGVCTRSSPATHCTSAPSSLTPGET